MIVFPNCKINLGLHVTRKREDGYHDLETIFYPVNFSDALECLPHPATGSPEFTVSGLPVTGNSGDNLCVKAWNLLRNTFPDLPPVRMHLHKMIPMGAGLGGGSSDGAFALRLLNRVLRLGLSNNTLRDMALQLGSDCPFFLENSPCFATGRGEIMEPVQIDLSGYTIVIVHPGLHISTATAFAGIRPQAPPQLLQEVIKQPVTAWRGNLTNDFEATVFQQYPGIAGIKEALYEAGAVYASMTGTGSAVYALFEKEAAQLPSFPPHYLVHIAG